MVIYSVNDHYFDLPTCMCIYIYMCVCVCVLCKHMVAYFKRKWFSLRHYVVTWLRTIRFWTGFIPSRGWIRVERQAFPWDVMMQPVNTGKNNMWLVVSSVLPMRIPIGWCFVSFWASAASGWFVGLTHVPWFRMVPIPERLLENPGKCCGFAVRGWVASFDPLPVRDGHPMLTHVIVDPGPYHYLYYT